jgi:hypothetical protein
VNGLAWTTVQLPFTAGLQQKADDRARQPPALDIALDVQFDELGGVQTRKPLQLLGSSYIDETVAGGTLTTARRIYAYGDELVLFDQENLYSWNQQEAKWIRRTTYLAVKTDEQAVFVNDDDQFDCDRAELDGVVLYAWSTSSEDIYVAAIDKETGSVRLSPTQVSNDGVSSTGTRPRLCALESVVLLLWVDTTDPGTHDLVGIAIDPANVGGTVTPGGDLIENGIPSDCYDVVKVTGDDLAICALSLEASGYNLYAIPPIVGDFTTSTKGRVSDGAIAVSVEPTGLQVQVIRANSTNIQGDLITIASFVDTAHVNKAVGTASGTVNQIAACHRSVTDGGLYRCYAFWHSAEDDAPTIDWTSKYNYVDTGGNLGTQANFIRKLAVASRAFDYNGDVYVNMAFAGGDASLRTFGNQLQNTFFLYRDDGLLVAKMAAGRAGGFPPSTGRLPHVELTDGTTTYSWCGTERRIVSTSTSQTRVYEDRGPRDITITFDSNEARRCVVLGRTLYVSGGEILQFDGHRLVELGFHVYPWALLPTEDDGTGAMEDGTYTYKITLRSDNSRGERDRSTTATYKEIELSGGGAQGVDIDTIVPLYVSHRHFASGDNRNPTLEVWRTEKDPTVDADFYLVTSKDPADTGASTNPYVVNNPTLHVIAATFSDELSDESILDNEANNENGGILENLSPPAGTILLASDRRLFLAGIAGEPDAVRYSKQRSESEVASFHDALTIPIPSEGGDITALAFLNETLIVFRQTAIYALPGDGFDNAGTGQNYGPARQIPGGCGAVNHECVAVTPRGLIFKSRKGWYILNHGWAVDYIGAAVSDYDDEEPLAVHLVEAQHQVRVVTASRVLVWDYLVNQWAEWTIDDGLHAAIWQGDYAYLTAAGPLVEVDYADEDLNYGLDVETAWIKPADLQGACRIRWAELLGEFRSSDLTHIRIRVAYNYVETYVDDKYWEVSPTTVGGPLQLRFCPQRPQCQSIKFRFTAIRRTEVVPELGDPIITNGAPIGEALKLTGLALELGVRRGLYRRLPEAQKA